MPIIWMPRAICEFALPHRDKGQQNWRRVHADGSGRGLAVDAGHQGMPWGVMPLLLLGHVTGLAVESDRRRIVIGSTRAFLDRFGIADTGAATASARDAVARLAGALFWRLAGGERADSGIHLFDQLDWHTRRCVLSRAGFDLLVRHPVGVPSELLSSGNIRRSPVALGLALWLLARRATFPHRVALDALASQIGGGQSGKEYARLICEAWPRIARLFPHLAITVETGVFSRSTSVPATLAIAGDPASRRAGIPLPPAARLAGDAMTSTVAEWT